MEKIILISRSITALGVIIGCIVSIWNAVKWGKRITEGVKCQLRSEMLHIYYRHREEETIRQYEYENFIYCHDAYTALGGNSFIQKIYEEVKTWEVIS